ncbi:peptidoglycan DD-metalloendopeptidase family protein [Pseudocolwellia sp. HL-MZ19]|uniref:peptidoglycan DD-metalloendopeptidase family protein n=1 Tax=unclassified Pseudocolwellia TaxID=2848178 RepID=UPI003CF1CC1D
MLRIYFIICLCLIGSSVFASNVYKYKDSNGNWVFSDQPPLTDVKVEETQYADVEKKVSPVKTYILNDGGMHEILAENTLYVPIEIELTFTESQKRFRHVIWGKSKKILYSNTNEVPQFTYRWIMGDPAAKIDNYLYKPPFSSGLSKQVTQGFNGQFSHNKPPNNFAVDIALPIGTYITAARAGTVIDVKDDYHMGGQTAYFLDKANRVMVLHSDSSYALYGHILLGTATVKVGDEVAVGDTLARSGSSGFSTGPHLHFIIYRNSGFSTESISFGFESNGKKVTPKRGMKLQSL